MRYNILLLFVLLNLINLIYSNPIINSIFHPLDPISPIQKEGPPLCLSFAGKLIFDSYKIVVPSYYGCIPFGKDIYSTVYYYVYEPDCCDNIYPTPITILNENKTILQYQDGNHVNSVYQYNQGGLSYRANFRDVQNSNKKFYHDTKNLLIYVDSKNTLELGLSLYNLTTNSSFIIETGIELDYFSIEYQVVTSSLTCDFNTDLCYIIYGNYVFEFDIDNESFTYYQIFISNNKYSFDSINGYKDKLLISGNINSLGYAYIYDKSTNTTEFIVSPTDLIYPLVLSSNSRYCGLVTRTTTIFYLIDMETGSYINYGNINITTRFKALDVLDSNYFYFSLSSIIPDSSSSSSSNNDHSSSINLITLLNSTLIIFIQLLLLFI